MERGPFISQTNDATVTKIVTELAPQCLNCTNKMLVFCIEKCCAQKALFCTHCDSGQHLAHRTNDLKLLLINYQLAPSSGFYNLGLLSEAIAILSEQITQSQRIVQNHTKLIEHYSALSEEAQKVRQEIQTSSAWYLDLHQCTFNYMSKLDTLMQSRTLFAQAVAKLDLHHRWPQIQTINVVDEFMRKNKDVFPNVNFYRVSTNIRDINYKTPNCLERVVLRTPLQSYLINNPNFLADVVNGCNRSQTIHADEFFSKRTTFRGNRLALEGSLDKWLSRSRGNAFGPKGRFTQILYASSFQNLKELKIDSLTQTLPQELQSLTVTNQSEFSQQTNFDFPPKLRNLHIAFNQESNIYRFRDVDSLVGPIEKLTLLKSLRLCTGGQILRGTTIRRLYLKALLDNMRMLEISDRIPQRSANGSMGGERSDEIADCNRTYRRLLAQVAALHRRYRVSEMCFFFRESLLEAIYVDHQYT